LTRDAPAPISAPGFPRITPDLAWFGKIRVATYSVQLDEKTGLDRLVNEIDKASVLINRYGCEVIGYRVFDSHPRNEREIPLLYRDGQIAAPSSGWESHATVLFPVVGGLKNNRSRLDDHVITSPGGHGFARLSTFIVVRSETNAQAAIHYRLSANAATKRFYPFEFQLDITYTLRDSDLTATFAVRNLEKAQDLYFCLGWHPGFRTPAIDGLGTKMGCPVLFKKGTYRKYLVNANCELLGKTQEIQLDGAIQTTEEELQGTILLEIDDPRLRTCTVRDPLAGLDIEVDFGDFPHLGLWSDVGYNFICIEPWQGMDDHAEQETFDKKVGVVRLAPGGMDQRSATVRPRFR
jgi:galactose mutarotase-like enzyme